MEITVTNQSPENDANVPLPLMELFQKYTSKKYGKKFSPFVHQAAVFRQIDADKEIFLGGWERLQEKRSLLLYHFSINYKAEVFTKHY